MVRLLQSLLHSKQIWTNIKECPRAQPDFLFSKKSFENNRHFLWGSPKTVRFRAFRHRNKPSQPFAAPLRSTSREIGIRSGHSRVFNGELRIAKKENFGVEIFGCILMLICFCLPFETRNKKTRIYTLASLMNDFNFRMQRGIAILKFSFFCNSNFTTSILFYYYF